MNIFDQAAGVGFMEALPLLIVLPLLLRLIPWRRPDSGGAAWPNGERWRTLPELGLGLLCGLLFLALSTLWMADFHVTNYPVLTSDFSEYCASVAAARDGDWMAYSNNRSRLAGLPSGVLARSLGIVDGLAYSAAISAALVGAGLYFWGRALHSRLAGVAVVLLALTIGPVTLIPRTLSYYPVITAAFLWSVVGPAVALRFRTLPAVALAGLTTGLVLLVDVRGLIWALPALGLSLLAAVAPRAWRSWKGWAWVPLRIGAVLGLLFYSNIWGSVAFAPGAVSLEAQLWGFQMDRVHNLSLDYQPEKLLTHYKWGHSDPWKIPETLRGTAKLASELPEVARQTPITVSSREAHVEPWRAPIVGALMIAAVALVRRPWCLIALSGLLPMAVTLKNASDYLVYPRYLQAPMLMFALLMGVAFVALAFDPVPKRSPEPSEPTERSGVGRYQWRIWARPAAAVLMALLLALGAIPSFLSPLASWRSAVGAGHDLPHLSTLLVAPEAVPGWDEMTCLDLLRQDYQEGGHPAGSRLHDLRWR